jgi:hypothetical protein
MAKVFWAIAAIYGGLGVAGGAFASHALQSRLPGRALEVFNTGIRYQMLHALALLAVALLLRQGGHPKPLVNGGRVGICQRRGVVFRQFVPDQPGRVKDVRPRDASGRFGFSRGLGMLGDRCLHRISEPLSPLSARSGTQGDECSTIQACPSNPSNSLPPWR